jgi:Tfp pilus assembly protein PilO
MNKSGYGLVIGVLIPVICAVAFGMVCFSQYKQRDLAQADMAQQQKNVDSLNHIMDMVKAEPLMSKHLAAEATPDEQASFLTQLRVDAQGAGVKLVQYMNQGQLMPQHPEDQNQSQSIYRPVASTLTVQGPYDGVRAFAYSLLRADRLMNMNGVSWKRDPDAKSTTLSFTLIRYVTDPVTTVQTTRVPVSHSLSDGGA